METLFMERKLPEELLNLIMLHCSRGSLIALCSCSKTMHRIATPHLYSTVSLDPGVALLPLAYLMFTSPVHASYVQNLTGNIFSTTNKPWPEQDKRKLDTTLMRASRRYTVDDKDAAELESMISHQSYRAREEAIFVLLFAHFGNLQKLQFTGSLSAPNPVQNTMIRVLKLVTRGRGSASCDASSTDIAARETIASRQYAPFSTPFTMPLDIMISGTDTYYSHRSVYVPAFLNLPNIRSLYAWRPSDDGFHRNDGYHPNESIAHDQFLRLKPLSYAVENIELRQAKFRREHLHHLVHALIPEKLQTFSYEVTNQSPRLEVQYEQIVQSLAPHYDTLQCLELSFDEHEPIHHWGTTINAPLSFRCFQNLKKLKVAPTFIWSHDELCHKTLCKQPSTRQMLWKALPETLEELWITRMNLRSNPRTDHITSLLVPALYILLENQDSFPLLTQLCFTFSASHWSEHREWVDLGWLSDLYSFSIMAEQKGISSLARPTDWFVVLRVRANPGWFDDAEPSPVQRKWGWYEDVEWSECGNNDGNDIPFLELAPELDFIETLKGYGMDF
jgi:hypothetical protein